MARCPTTYHRQNAARKAADAVDVEAGPEFALLAAAYGWTPDVIDRLTQTQLLYYLRWLPLIEGRRAYPLASIEASMLNAAGGKPDPADADRPPPRPQHLLFTPTEMLPPWATLDTGPGVWTRDSARDALEHAALLPVDALSRLDFQRLRALAGA